jgi:gliding motility-associated-like protein
MMRHFLFFIAVLVLMPLSSRAQFSATGGTNGKPYEVIPSAGTGLDKVFVFNGMQNASLIFSVSNPSEWKWYRYLQNPNSAIAVNESDVSLSASSTILTNIQSGYGYYVTSGDGLKRYVYIIGYEPVIYNEISFLNEGNVCSEVTLKVSAVEPEMNYYSVSGLKHTLERQHTLTWNTQEWNASSSTYNVKEMTAMTSNLQYNWSVEAPLTNTDFTIKGDQYAIYFGIPRILSSSVYHAVSVKTSATAVLQERTAENETGKSTGDLSGSAPLVVQFYSHPSDAVKLVEWFIYKPNDETGAYTRFTDQDLNYSFKEVGKYTVKVYVSSSSCVDSAIFYPQVSDFFLDCPNFFTPRSSPGENDEFRVAYRSIISFKGVIVNRWGNVIFEWNDPALGWDGNYKGKPVSPGVYFYVIEATGSDGKVHKKNGDINLLE